MNDDIAHYAKTNSATEIFTALTEAQSKKLGKAIEESDIDQEISFQEFKKIFLRELAKVKRIV
jgi:hypothetical protein